VGGPGGHGFGLVLLMGDDDAGRVDDVIVVSPGRLDAYQIKWAKAQKSYTFQAILKSSPEAPSIWRQLSEGWKALRMHHSGATVFVHFITNEIASAQDSLRSSVDTRVSFQELWSEVLLPLSRRDIRLPDVDSKYVAALSDLEVESGLASQDIAEFIQHCFLTFNYPDPRQIESASVPGAARR
jgi:hypothetical protein